MASWPGRLGSASQTTTTWWRFGRCSGPGRANCYIKWNCSHIIFRSRLTSQPIPWYPTFLPSPATTRNLASCWRRMAGEQLQRQVCQRLSDGQPFLGLHGWSAEVSFSAGVARSAWFLCANPRCAQTWQVFHGEDEMFRVSDHLENYEPWTIHNIHFRILHSKQWQKIEQKAIYLMGKMIYKTMGFSMI